MALLPFVAMTAGASSEIVRFVVGPAFAPAATLFSVLLVGTMAGFLISLMTAMLTAIDRPSHTFVLTGPLVPLAAIGHLILIPRMGAFGASLVTTLCAVGGAVAGMLMMRREWRLSPPWRTLSRGVLLSPLAYVLAAAWVTGGVWVFAKLVLIGCAVVLSFVLLGEFSAHEIVLASVWWNNRRVVK
jgi:O-antigen/teichoic acid export membrane protein